MRMDVWFWTYMSLNIWFHHSTIFKFIIDSDYSITIQIMVLHTVEKYICAWHATRPLQICERNDSLNESMLFSQWLFLAVDPLLRPLRVLLISPIVLVHTKDGHVPNLSSISNSVKGQQITAQIIHWSPVHNMQSTMLFCSVHTTSMTYLSILVRCSLFCCST